MNAPALQVPTKHGTLEIFAPLDPAYSAMLSREALDFVAELSGVFSERILQLLDRRRKRQAQFDSGVRPNFLSETAHLRQGDWTVAPLPPDLLDRRVEITGPVSRKMVINALNSGANVFMADFEDSNAPTWSNLVEGQINLFDAVRRNIEYRDPQSGKSYRLHDSVATLMVRPRGLHLREEHLRLAGHPVPGALFDFGLYFFHNARELIARGTGPYFYLPKLESHLEARLWNDVFLHAQQALGLPAGTIKATVLIETLPAAFEMHEILWELRQHAAGLNCGRWDYIFSFIKTFREDHSFVLPDRGQVTMEQPFLRAYTQLAIQTCHRRGVHSMGGMAAQIPIKNDPKANETALAKVRADKLREVTDGHDGTWVAHPGLVGVAREIFDAHLKRPNQIDRTRSDFLVTAQDLIRVPTGTRTETGFRNNVSVGLQYLAAWLGGNGCVPLLNLMEDAATAEIARTQLWQWIRHDARLEDGRQVTVELFHQVAEEELEKLRSLFGPDPVAQSHLQQAHQLLTRLVTAAQCEDFLTLPAYELIKTTSQTVGDAGSEEE